MVTAVGCTAWDSQVTSTSTSSILRAGSGHITGIITGGQGEEVTTSVNITSHSTLHTLDTGLDTGHSAAGILLRISEYIKGSEPFRTAREGYYIEQLETPLSQIVYS